MISLSFIGGSTSYIFLKILLSENHYLQILESTESGNLYAIDGYRVGFVFSVDMGSRLSDENSLLNGIHSGPRQLRLDPPCRKCNSPLPPLETVTIIPIISTQ